MSSSRAVTAHAPLHRTVTASLPASAEASLPLSGALIVAVVAAGGGGPPPLPTGAARTWSDSVEATSSAPAALLARTTTRTCVVTSASPAGALADLAGDVLAGERTA